MKPNTLKKAKHAPAIQFIIKTPQEHIMKQGAKMCFALDKEI